MKTKNVRVYDTMLKTFVNTVEVDTNMNTVPADLIQRYWITLCSGILDINGVEIYEGDILNIYYPEPGYLKDESGKNIRLIVEFQREDFYLKQEKRNLIWGKLINHPDYFEGEDAPTYLVVGNIFDKSLSM